MPTSASEIVRAMRPHPMQHGSKRSRNGSKCDGALCVNGSDETVRNTGPFRYFRDSVRIKGARGYVSLAISLALLMATRTVGDPATTIREFLDGKRATFNTKGHPKAKGVVMTIGYPLGWLAEEGNRPNIVQQFTSDRGNGREGMTILAKTIPLPPGSAVSAKDKAELVEESTLREMVPPGATFISAQSTKIEAEPAGILEYIYHGERAGIQLAMRCWALVFMSDRALVYVTFHVGGPEGSEEELTRRMAEFQPLFRLMANSIVLPEKWTRLANTASESAAPARKSSNWSFDDPATLFVELALSFVVTWTLGLAPPLLIRYVFVRRPLQKKSASWIAFGFCGAFWLLFRLIAVASGEPGGGAGGAVWFLFFLFARETMCHGVNAQSGTNMTDANQNQGVEVSEKARSPSNSPEKRFNTRCPNPSCGKRLIIKTSQATKTVECPACGKSFVFQTASSQSATRPSSVSESETY